MFTSRFNTWPTKSSSSAGSSKWTTTKNLPFFSQSHSSLGTCSYKIWKHQTPHHAIVLQNLHFLQARKYSCMQVWMLVSPAWTDQHLFAFPGCRQIHSNNWLLNWRLKTGWHQLTHWWCDCIPVIWNKIVAGLVYNNFAEWYKDYTPVPVDKCNRMESDYLWQWSSGKDYCRWMAFWKPEQKKSSELRHDFRQVAEMLSINNHA